MQEKKIILEISGQQESYTFGTVARQANGSVLYRQGKAVLLATVTWEPKAVDEGFLPLTVQYLERAYAAAKIPGGFIKRESKPGDFETLTSRIIDRSLRPLFPEGFTYPTVITVMVLSADEEVDLQVAALHAANAALLVSDLPVEQSIAAVRVGRSAEGEIRFHPPLSLLEEGSLDLLVVGSGEELLMIEMAAKATERVEVEEITPLDPMAASVPVMVPLHQSNEVSEEELSAWIEEAMERVEEMSREFEEHFLPLKRESRMPWTGPDPTDPELLLRIREDFGEKIAQALEPHSKDRRAELFEAIIQEIVQYLEVEGLEAEDREIRQAVGELKSGYLRRNILERGVRPDGRALDQVRPISIETNLLPGVHGSCLFTRGETQALATVTLGDSKAGQIYELLTDKAPRTERFMVHYNFPPFSVGEARPLSAPSRRELGHGNLAKRALEPVLDPTDSRTIRLVSEILESNGSSSMATVCGGALALASAEVEMSAMVAGVAMGLVRQGEQSAILTDIMGLEDHEGEMDLKVAGTSQGITAMQMDVKEGGLDMELLRRTLLQAREARLSILEIMERAREAIVPSGALPVTEHFHIDPSKIVHVIGKAGSTIREIIEKFEVKIDLDRDRGGVKVTGPHKEKVQAAREHIEQIATREEAPVPTFERGRIYDGVVKRIVDFGIFVELPGGYDALLHVSKMPGKRVSDFRPGETIRVKVLDQKGRKVELALPEYEG
ncbi:MAG: polyribonucleotide nucleotidyltransferase [Epsilonproteobacteria bacterium]|nr:polyribonucleotide nucleotidyltransferase [Campylobacterota bacterium]